MRIRITDFACWCVGGINSFSSSTKHVIFCRADEIPQVLCAHTIQQQQQLSQQPPEEEDEGDKLPIAGALDSWALDRHPDDLRRSLVKARLAAAESSAPCPTAVVAASVKAACPGGRLTKSDSMDSMLGESLLDPPQSLSRMTPRRYQSPSRCGSPSLEAPDHLLLGRNNGTGAGGISSAASSRDLHYRPPPPSYDQAVFSMSAFGHSGRGGEDSSCSATSASGEAAASCCRLNRHDLLRRRDLNLFHGLHPRLLHGQPRLSLPPKQQPHPPQLSAAASALPCRARVTGGGGIAAAAERSTRGGLLPLTDRLPNHCTLSGKHICQYEEELEETSAHAPAPLAATARTTPPLPCQQTQARHLPLVSTSSSSSSTSSTSSASSSASPTPPLFSGEHYQQTELGGAKARRGGWSGRHHVRTTTPYSRDSSSCSSGLAEEPPQKLLKAANNNINNSKAFYQEEQLGDPSSDLSQSEMEEVLQLLTRSRASPISQKEVRRPSLKEEQAFFPSPQDLLCLQQGKSRRPSLDEIFDPLGEDFSFSFFINWERSKLFVFEKGTKMFVVL